MKKRQKILRSPFAVETVWSNGQTFTQDAPNAQADILRIEDGARIYFRDGILFKLKCNKLIVGNTVFFDGRGSDGADSTQPPPRPPVKASGTAAQHQYEIHPVFLKWATRPEYGYFGYDAPPAHRGGQGARILIQYHNYEGAYFDPKKQVDVRGGRGGKGSPGGLGAFCHCTINPCSGVLKAGDGRSAPDADDGPPGTFELREY